jgi:hypothetical protein
MGRDTGGGMGRLRAIWNDPKSLSALVSTLMLAWFLVWGFFILPRFSQNVVAGVAVFEIVGGVPALAILYRLVRISKTARADSPT